MQCNTQPHRLQSVLVGQLFHNDTAKRQVAMVYHNWYCRNNSILYGFKKIKGFSKKKKSLISPYTFPYKQRNIRSDNRGF